ncbi:uncharacterized protein Tco025E_07159, partial [Trypanosoma conorhini]
EFLMSMCFISPPCWDGPSLPDGEQTVCDASDSENHDVLDEYGLFAAVADGGKLKPLVPDGPAQKSTRGSVFDIRKANPSPLAAELSLSPSGNQCLRECKERTTAAAAAAGGSENELGNQLVSRERAQQKSPESRCGLELATCPCSAPSRKNLAEQPPRRVGLPSILPTHDEGNWKKVSFVKKRLARYNLRRKHHDERAYGVNAVAFISSPESGDKGCSREQSPMTPLTETSAVSIVDHEPLSNGSFVALEASYHMDEVISSADVGTSQALTSLLNRVHCGQRSFLLSTYAPGCPSTSVMLIREFLKALLRRFREGEVEDQTNCTIWLSLAAVTTPSSAVDMLQNVNENEHVVPIRSGYLALCGPLLMDLSWHEISSEECLANIASRMRRRLRCHPENMVVGTLLVSERSCRLDPETNIPETVLTSLTMAITKDPMLFVSIGRSTAAPLQVFFAAAFGGAAATTHVTCVEQRTSNNLSKDYFDYALRLQQVVNDKPFVYDVGRYYLKARKLLRGIERSRKKMAMPATDDADIKHLWELVHEAGRLLSNTGMTPTNHIRAGMLSPSLMALLSAKAGSSGKRGGGVHKRKRVAPVAFAQT